ncbi:hypothetical protein INT45_011558 [Circinella minor]|uniref:Uncharacterized protein n=1 Tax=Circinella minor TaxID=1195481 RepID=A0A8H7S7L4_9FUNG|nr:hypothetical protein INT45_011558 [Circinella minor]
MSNFQKKKNSAAPAVLANVSDYHLEDDTMSGTASQVFAPSSTSVSGFAPVTPSSSSSSYAPMVNNNAATSTRQE